MTRSALHTLKIFSLKSAAMPLLLLLCGCSTVLEGTSQHISVESVPSGANCILRSNDDVIAQVPSTPAVITVQKSKYDIVVECNKDGYLKGKGKNHSDYAISGLTNSVFGEFGMLGSMMDSATGAGNKYDSKVIVELEKAPAPMVAKSDDEEYIVLDATPAAPTPVAQANTTNMPAYQLSSEQVAQVTAALKAVPALSGQPTVQMAALPTATDPAHLPPFDVAQ